MEAKQVTVKIFDFDIEVRRALAPFIKNKVVLDIGGYDGKQAAWAKQEGAKKAICIDNGEWKLYQEWEPFHPFIGVNYIYGDFYQYDRMADVTIFQNVLYHQKNPWLALEKVRSLTRDVMVLSTSYVKGNDPLFYLFDNQEANENFLTVSWKPTPSGLMRLIKNSGFHDIEKISEKNEHIIVRCKP